MAQDRKIFVGGVPQDLTQDDLYAIFSAFAGVKRAWLQKCRATDDKGTNVPNHRGFGFVIFHDARTIEDLLGDCASCFVPLRNGVKVEVKRAVSSNKMSGVSWTELPPAHPKPSPQVPRVLRGRQEACGVQVFSDVAWASADDESATYASSSMLPFHSGSSPVGSTGSWYWPLSDSYGRVPRSSQPFLERSAMPAFENMDGQQWKPAVPPGLDRRNPCYIKDVQPLPEDGDLDVDLSHLIEEFETSQIPQRQSWLPCQ